MGQDCLAPFRVEVPKNSGILPSFIRDRIRGPLKRSERELEWLTLTYSQPPEYLG